MTSMSEETVYVAGPMSGLPLFNFPAFTAATASLRAKGLSVISPHELDSPAIKAAAVASPDGALVDGKVGGETWGQILARDVQIVADRVNAIAFLPGWQGSRGAKLEATVGILCGHKFYTYNEGDLVPMGTEWVKHQLAVSL